MSSFEVAEAILTCATPHRHPLKDSIKYCGASMNFFSAT